MKIQKIDHTKKTTTIIDTPFTVRQFLTINIAGWGFYSIIKNGKDYNVIDKFTGELIYTIKKC
jgi:hypothetical protein